MKASLQSFVHFILFGNIFVSICAASLTYINALYFNLEYIANPLSLFIFCATNIAYNFQRLFRIRKTSIEQESIRLTWIKKNKLGLLIYNYILSGIGCFSLFHLPKTTLIFLLPIGLISLWYVIGFKKIPALRNIPFVKLFVIGLIWGVSTFGLPFFLAGHTTYSSHNFLSLIAISGFVISQTIPFDIRDIHFDNKLHLKTLAQYLGLKKSKLLSTFGFLVLSVLFYQLAQQESTYNSSIILYSYSISSLMALSLIVGINANRKEIYFSGIIESILFFPFLIYLFWMNAI